MSTQEGYLGIRERFIVETESSYGSTPSLTNAEVLGYDIEVTPNFAQNFQETRQAGSDSRTINSKIAGGLSLGYQLKFFPASWRALKFVFDIDSETGSDPYTHTLSVGDTLKSFTAEWSMPHGTDPLNYYMWGNVMTKFQIDFQKSSGEGRDGFVQCTADVITKDYTSPASRNGGSFSVSGDPFQYRHLAVTLQSGAVVPINSGSLVFEQGINPNDSRYASTSVDRTIAAPIATIFRISGRLNLNLFETTFSDMWEAATALTGTNTIVFEQSSSNKVTFTLTNVYVDPVPISGTNIDGINTGDFVFTATGVAVVAIDNIQNW